MPKRSPPTLPAQTTDQDDAPLARRATALMSQWVFERTDDQAAFSRMGTAAAGCITYAAAAVLAIGSQQPLCSADEASLAAQTCNTIPAPMLVVAPLPLWFLFCSILIALKGVQRRQATIELLELELGQLNARENPWPQHPSSRTDSASTFYDLFLTRCVQIVMYGGALLVTVGATVGAALLVFHVDGSPLWRATTIAADVLMVAVVVPFAIRRPSNPHATTLASLRGEMAPEESDATPPRAGRTLLSYLVMPRPRYVVKWLFFPVMFGMAVWAEGGASAGSVVDAALLLFALECLIYPARYQWNDIRGFVDDARHPDWMARGRLPHGSTPAESRRIILISLTVVAGRLLAAAAIGILQPQLLIPIGVLVAAVFTTGAIYEGWRARRRAIALWMFVGVGYAIRGVTGLVAGGLPWDGVATLAGAVALVAFGIAFVTMTWALEGLGHCEVTSSKVLCTKELLEKPHLYRLLAYMDAEPAPDVFASAKTDLERQRLSGRREHRLRAPGRLLTPWNLALVLACLCAGITGASLAQPPTADLTLTVAAALTGVGLSGLIVVAPGTFARSAVVVAGTTLLGGLGVLADAHYPVLMAVPYAIVAAVFVWFRAQSYETLTAVTPAAKGVVNAGRQVLAWVVGPQTQNAAELGVRAEATEPAAQAGRES